MADEKQVYSKSSLGKEYTRVIETRPVTYICQECGQEVTEDLYPGPAPKICFGCIGVARRRKAAERQRRFRERRRAENENQV